MTPSAGSAVAISHDRFFLDRIGAHMLAFEGESHGEWFEGNFEDYEADRIRRLGPDAMEACEVDLLRPARDEMLYDLGQPRLRLRPSRASASTIKSFRRALMQQW